MESLGFYKAIYNFSHNLISQKKQAEKMSNEL